MSKIGEKIYKIVYEWKTKYEHGFLNEEIKEVLKLFPGINMEKYYDAMMCNTCMVIDGKTVIYHIDVCKAITCGVENRELTLAEWD